MKREVVSLAVGIVLLAVGCSGDSRPVASSSPASVDTRADVEHQLETTGGKVAAWLRAEPWPLDGTTTSLTAVTAITGASYDNDPAKAQTKQDDVMRLLDAVKASSWYDGRPSDAEKASIAAAFTLASKLPAEVAKTNARTGEPLYPQLEKFSWVDLLADALKQRHFTSVAGAVEPTITLLSADTSDDAAADETLLYASSNLSEIESLAGSYRTPYLLFVLDPALDPDLCGQAFPDESLILIQPTCLGAEVVVHEMTHIATPSIGFAVWYEEGTAYLIAAKLSGGLAPDKLAATRLGITDDTFLLNALEKPSYGEREQMRDSDAGFLFFVDLTQIIGWDAVSTAIKSVPAVYLGDDVLKAILKQTPPDKHDAVAYLIRERCRTTARSGTGWCRAPCRPDLDYLIRRRRIDQRAAR